jgi:hypothetical protein
MITIALPRKRIRLFDQARQRVAPYSLYAVLSITCTAAFILYVLAYSSTMFNPESVSHILMTSFFILGAPALGLCFSVVALRRYVKKHEEVRGMFLAYVSFFVSSLYFVTALAMPLVLLVMYVVYVSIW